MRALNECISTPIGHVTVITGRQTRIKTQHRRPPRVSEGGHVRAAPTPHCSRCCPTPPPPHPQAPTTSNTVCPGLCFGPQIPYSAPHQRRVAHDQREVTCLVGTRPYTSSIVCRKSPRSPRSSRSSTPS